jgi:hypothetical protein
MQDMDLATPDLQRLSVAHIYDLMALTLGATRDAAAAAADRARGAAACRAAGLGDVSYFHRAFRRRYDLLPADVRARARGVH